MEDLSRLTVRELLTRARERFGAAASPLKTREELVAALRAGSIAAPAPVEPPPQPSLPPPAPAPAPRAPPARAPGVAPGAAVVTRDFFRRRT